MKRVLRNTGRVYVVGCVLMAAVHVFSYYYYGFIPLKRLPYDLAVVLLWPVALAFVLASALGLAPPPE